MNKATEPILELLDDAGVAMNSTGISYELSQRMTDPPGEATMYRALKKLQTVGYITQPVDGKSLYVITNKGREWLAGDRDAGHDLPD